MTLAVAFFKAFAIITNDIHWNASCFVNFTNFLFTSSCLMAAYIGVYVFCCENNGLISCYETFVIRSCKEIKNSYLHPKSKRNVKPISRQYIFYFLYNYLFQRPCRANCNNQSMNFESPPSNLRPHIQPPASLARLLRMP